MRECLDVRHDFVSSDGPNIAGGWSDMYCCKTSAQRLQKRKVTAAVSIQGFLKFSYGSGGIVRFLQKYVNTMTLSRLKI